MKRIGLPLREWLELGQAMPKSFLAPKWFRAYHTLEICIGKGLKIKADGETYKAGRYYLRIPLCALKWW